VGKAEERKRLEERLSAMIDQAGLSTDEKKTMRSRWLYEVLRMDHQVRADREMFYWLRVPVVIGAVALPAIVNLKVSGNLAAWARWTPFVLSLIVAVAVALESLLRYGPRWRVYRRSSDALQSEGWKFFQLADEPYKGKTHAEAYPEFAKNVEDILERYSTDYLNDVASGSDQPGKAPGGQ
jgi:hypothetical protein